MQYETESLCPVCYEKIPAVLHAGGDVVMAKQCSQHGEFEGLVERDVEWFNICREFGSTNIYDGLLIDVTGKCNLRCKYCYHSKSSGHRSKESIVHEVRSNLPLSSFYLTGGEPTLHPELPSIINEAQKSGETWILSNGVKLCDERLLIELCRAGLLLGKRLLLLGLSFHKESGGKDIEFLELCRKYQLVVGTTFWVIDDVEQMEEAVEVYSLYSDVIRNMRIKAASNLWVEGAATNHIFVSDMIRKLQELGETRLLTEGVNNKISFANTIHKDMAIMLVSWYNINNIDLVDIDCGPYYRANDGCLYNFVTAAVLNERYPETANFAQLSAVGAV